jgi:hypothetical protein
MKYEKGRLLSAVLKKRSAEKAFLFAIRLFLTVHLRIKMGGTLYWSISAISLAQATATFLSGFSSPNMVAQPWSVT